MKTPGQAQKFHTRILRRRKRKSDNFLLNETDFRFAADCERMRVDRNRSVLSLLLIRLPETHSAEKDVAFLSRVLEGRLRITDTPGLYEKDCVGVLLPDTPAEGAWKVAEDVSEVYPPGPDRPQCQVLIYPDQHLPRKHEEEGATVGARDSSEVDKDSSDWFFSAPVPAWKRLVDLGGASVGLLLASPLILAAAAAIKASSPGPVFFFQEREGRGGRRFKIVKMRTMRTDAEKRKADLRPLSHQDGPAFKLPRDPRTTTIGRFLRWTSMDELPQFWNVLRGEMSLVGPRPLPVDESQACLGWQRRRLAVTPGMTCTWQVSARGNVLFDDWVRMDLAYADQQSPVQDAKLIAITLPSLLLNRGMR
ncbi:sugar transferase [Adhaeretor mobilis]|uniref:Putative sugar transferase EpsL n=1 Tax=Adhaeretor mobilis TaxID=1930276 RepID=A0A517MVT2_9BACT|nr:sugar transferase [Adhaeretor mobilis]QDS98992.1 putative sugar transferase EpsL [Adhaeretor mobilis]